MKKRFYLGKLDWMEALAFVIVLGIIYTVVYNIAPLTSMLITVTFILTLYLYISRLMVRRLDAISNRLLILSLMLAFLNVTISGIGSFDYYKKVIMYSCTLILLVCNISTRISLKTVFFVYGINVIIAILYLLTYNQGYNYYEGENLLTLNFTNPNQAGMFIYTTLLYILLPIVSIEKPLKPIKTLLLSAIFIPLALSLLKMLMLTGCRSAMMALCIFVCLIACDYLRGPKKWIKKWMLVIIAIMPFIFVFVYLVYASTVVMDVSFGIESAGKSAMTRMDIWQPIVRDFFHYFVFGDYYGISKGTGASQMHNTHLDIYSSYGIVPLILFITILTRSMWITYANSKLRFQRTAVYAFISTMVIGTFEASYVAGSAGLFVLINGFLLVANCNTNEDIAS